MPKKKTLKAKPANRPKSAPKKARPKKTAPKQAPSKQATAKTSAARKSAAKTTAPRRKVKPPQSAPRKKAPTRARSVFESNEATEPMLEDDGGGTMDPPTKDGDGEGGGEPDGTEE